MKRREFLSKAGVGAGAVAAAGALKAPAVIASKKYRWKMVTTWPPKSPVMQEYCEIFAKRLKEATDGRVRLTVYAGGELTPPLETFEVVSRGTVQVGCGASFYWAGKVRASQWYTSIPFGMNAQGNNTWLSQGGGLKLWEEAYAPFNLLPRPMGNTGAQMGGWFNKQIRKIEDFKGLKIRMPGLGGKVMAKAGAVVTLLPGAEIFTNLERGVIDATEWVGPLLDKRAGLHQAAKYYYYPGWHEPGSPLEIFFNKKLHDSLPKDIKSIIDALTWGINLECLALMEKRNAEVLNELIFKHGVKLKKFPKKVLDKLKKISVEVMEEEANKDKLSRKIHDSYTSFQKMLGPWNMVSEKTYYDSILDKHSLTPPKKKTKK